VSSAQAPRPAYSASASTQRQPSSLLFSTAAQKSSPQLTPAVRISTSRTRGSSTESSSQTSETEKGLNLRRVAGAWVSMPGSNTSSDSQKPVSMASKVPKMESEATKLKLSSNQVRGNIDDKMSKSFVVDSMANKSEPLPKKPSLTLASPKVRDASADSLIFSHSERQGVQFNGLSILANKEPAVASCTALAAESLEKKTHSSSSSEQEYEDDFESESELNDVSEHGAKHAGSKLQQPHARSPHLTAVQFDSTFVPPSPSRSPPSPSRSPPSPSRSPPSPSQSPPSPSRSPPSPSRAPLSGSHLFHANDSRQVEIVKVRRAELAVKVTPSCFSNYLAHIVLFYSVITKAKSNSIDWQSIFANLPIQLNADDKAKRRKMWQLFDVNGNGKTI
jgi:hypothetical protein